MSTFHEQKNIALKIVQTLQENGYVAYFAGGCVRDELLGRTPKDFDIASSAHPEEVEALFPKTLAIGKAFGVIAVIEGKQTVEVATFRKDVGSLDGRRPEQIAFCAAREDAIRRDFTVNGIFCDPLTGILHDYVDGQADLERKVIRAIGDPSERFREDHLRMLRAIRFAYTLDFELDPATFNAIQEHAPLIRQISAERIEQELSRTMIESKRPGDALQALHHSGLLEQILPELIPMVGQEQPPQFHPEGDVFEHTILMLNLMAENETANTSYSAREMAYTVLLHDVGKPPTASIGPGTDGEPRIRFDGHAAKGAHMAEEILLRLRIPTKERKHIVAAIHGHMRFMDVQKMRNAKLRRMIGAETFALELELHRLDCLGSHAMLDNYEHLIGTMEQMANEPVLPEPWINGSDLISMGLKPGPHFGPLLKKAYDFQIEEHFTDRESLLDWVRTQGHRD